MLADLESHEEQTKMIMTSIEKLASSVESVSKAFEKSQQMKLGLHVPEKDTYIRMIAEPSNIDGNTHTSVWHTAAMNRYTAGLGFVSFWPSLFFGVAGDASSGDDEWINE